jgi:hypothetical protein
MDSSNQKYLRLSESITKAMKSAGIMNKSGLIQVEDDNKKEEEPKSQYSKYSIFFNSSDNQQQKTESDNEAAKKIVKEIEDLIAKQEYNAALNKARQFLSHFKDYKNYYFIIGLVFDYNDHL